MEAISRGSKLRLERLAFVLQLPERLCVCSGLLGDLHSLHLSLGLVNRLLRGVCHRSCHRRIHSLQKYRTYPSSNSRKAHI